MSGSNLVASSNLDGAFASDVNPSNDSSNNIPDFSMGSSLEFLEISKSSFLSRSSGIAKLSTAPQLPEVSITQKRQPVAKSETAGKGWFDMKAPELTAELRDDLRVLRNRAFLDPKRHYKRDGKKGMQIPKFFQLGTVIEAPHEFYSSRLANRERHTSLARELLADSDVRSYMKRKATQIIATRPNKKKLKFKKSKQRY